MAQNDLRAQPFHHRLTSTQPENLRLKNNSENQGEAASTIKDSGDEEKSGVMR